VTHTSVRSLKLVKYYPWARMGVLPHPPLWKSDRRGNPSG